MVEITFRFITRFNNVKIEFVENNIEKHFLFSKIKTLEQEKLFTELLQNSLNCSSDTLPLLAEGFRESKRHIKVKD